MKSGSLLRKGLVQVSATHVADGLHAAPSAGQETSSGVNGVDEVTHKITPAGMKAGKAHTVDCRYRPSEEYTRASIQAARNARIARMTTNEASNIVAHTYVNEVLTVADAVFE